MTTQKIDMTEATEEAEGKMYITENGYRKLGDLEQKMREVVLGYSGYKKEEEKRAILNYLRELKAVMLNECYLGDSSGPPIGGDAA